MHINMKKLLSLLFVYLNFYSLAQPTLIKAKQLGDGLGTGSFVVTGGANGSMTYAAQSSILAPYATTTSLSAYQPSLNGTGFVKATGTVISYDNTSYAPTSTLSNYVPYVGATGSVNIGNNTFSNSTISFSTNGIITTNSTISTSTNNGSFWYDGGLSGNHGFNFYSKDASNLSDVMSIGSGTNSFNFHSETGSSTYNLLYTPLNTRLAFSSNGISDNAYEIDRNAQSWVTASTSSPTGNAFIYQWTALPQTGQTASAEHVSFIFNGSSTQYSVGALARHRNFRISQRTISFTGASILTDAANLYIESALAAGTNATLTNSSALLISGMTGTISLGSGVVNGYGLSCYAPTGATNNYAARFLGGNVGIGTSSPQAGLDVATTMSVGSTATISGALTTPTVYGSSSGSGSLVLRSNSTSTSGIIQIGAGSGTLNIQDPTYVNNTMSVQSTSTLNGLQNQGNMITVGTGSVGSTFTAGAGIKITGTLTVGNTSTLTGGNSGTISVLTDNYFTLNSSFAIQALASGSTYYWSTNSGLGVRTTVNQSTVSIPYDCTLVGASITAWNVTSTTSQTVSTLNFRLNGVDNPISSNVLWNTGGCSNCGTSINVTGLNISVSAGDRWENKLVMGTMATPPNNGNITVTYYFARR